MAVPTTSGATRARRNTGIPVFPCVCLGLGFGLLTVTLFMGGPSTADNDATFVSASYPAVRSQDGATAKRDSPVTQLRVDRGPLRGRKRTVWDERDAEWYRQGEIRRAQKEALWKAAEQRNFDRVASGLELPGNMGAPAPKADSGFKLPEFSFPSFPAPAPAPAPVPVKAPAPAPAPSSGGDDGNPFAFLAQLFGQTTTTTTTTTLDPFSAFFANFR